MRARAPRDAGRCSHCGRASACRRWDRRRSPPAPASRSWLQSSAWSSPSPARLRDAGDATLSSQRPETDAAHAELAQVRARPPADAATIVEPNLELRVDQVPLPALERRLLCQTPYLFLNGMPRRVSRLRASSSLR